MKVLLKIAKLMLIWSMKNFPWIFFLKKALALGELTHETLSGGKFFPPKLMLAVIDTLVEISFVNKPGGR